MSECKFVRDVFFVIIGIGRDILVGYFVFNIWVSFRLVEIDLRKFVMIFVLCY